MKLLVRSLLRSGILLFLLPSALVTVSAAQKLAITLDDLPLNGLLPAGVTRTEITRTVLAILKERHAPPVYGFINAKKLEGNADAAVVPASVGGMCER